jgi:hypothetical protein
MGIDYEQLKPQPGEKPRQINGRISQAASEVVDYLVYAEKYSSAGEFLSLLVGQAIESRASAIREEIDKPNYREFERFARVLDALDSLCPPESDRE